MTTAISTDSKTPLAKAPAANSISEPVLCIAVVGRAGDSLHLVQRLKQAADWCMCEEIEDLDRADETFFRRMDVAILVDRHDQTAEEARPSRPSTTEDRQLHLLRLHRVGALILSERPWRFVGYGFGTVALHPSASVDMVHGVLLALARSRPVMRLLDKQVDGIRRLSESLSKQFAETQHELQLAARLQSEFLPRELPQTGPLRFATLYRPSSWVSGDLFDVFKLDDRRWGLYLADVMGHGVAAGLLTMYIKHAITPKNADRRNDEMSEPGRAFHELNDLLVRHEFRDSQFVTAWYGNVDTETLTMNYAVAGHPPALLVNPDGGMRELHADGCALGISSGQPFETVSTELRPGDRVMIYSDGLEPTLIAHRESLQRMPALVEGMPEVLRLPADELIAELERRLNASPGSLTRADDVSILVMDVVG